MYTFIRLYTNATHEEHPLDTPLMENKPEKKFHLECTRLTTTLRIKYYHTMSEQNNPLTVRGAISSTYSEPNFFTTPLLFNCYTVNK